MEKIINKIINKIILSFLVMVVLFTFTTEILYFASPVSSWYEYGSVPVRYVGNNENNEPLFMSNVVYKKDIRMEWFDSLYCVSCIIPQKLQTQYWTDVKRKNTTATDSWAYTQDTLQDGKEYTMCGVVKGRTSSTTFRSSGYLKTFNYCTDPFIYKIN